MIKRIFQKSSQASKRIYFRLKYGSKFYNILKEIAVLDVETTKKGGLVISGIKTIEGYKYFLDSKDYFNWLKEKNIKQVFAHNLEFDFFKVWEKNKHIKFTAYYHSSGLSYVQSGKVFYKDTLNHLSFSLKKIGKLLNLEKGKINYKKIKDVTKELIEYNKRDCDITFLAVCRILKIYRSLGISKIKASIASAGFELFNKKFNKMQYKLIDEKILNDWRMGYKGGWVEVFRKGKFRGKFYLIDVNSLFPFVMRFKYPYPYDFIKSKKLKKYYFFVLGIDKRNNKCYNSIEHNLKDYKCDYFYHFTRSMYPFKEYVEFLGDKKEKTKDKIEREILKKLMNALYGRFAQLPIMSTITTSQKSKKNLIEKVQITNILFKEKIETKSKYWVNVVWSLFVTAYARTYMWNVKSWIDKQGLKIYYCDTDSFILSGNIKKINKILDDNKIGKFALEKTAHVIDIKGKKLYMFGKTYKAKGVPKKYQKEFLNKGKVKYEKMVRLKESFRTGLVFGSWFKTEKENKENK